MKLTTLIGTIVATLALLSSGHALAQTCIAPGACNASSVNRVFFVDGVTYATVNDAMAACPAEGCVIDATGGLGSRVIGVFDPAGRTISLRLGPYAYDVEQITLRPGLEIIGQSKITNLRSTNPNVPVVVLPSGIDKTAFGVRLKGLYITPASLETTNQTAILLDATRDVNNGLWHSTFEDITIVGFGGVGVHLLGPGSTTDRLNQILQFRNLYVLRAGGGEAVRIEGDNGQVMFFGGQLIGRGMTRTSGPNVFIGTAGSTNINPYSIQFYGVTVEDAELGFLFSGSGSVNLDSLHMENLAGGFKFQNGGAQNGVITIQNSALQWVGTSGGQGFIIDSSSSGPELNIAFRSNWLATMPDNFVIPATPGTHGQAIRWTDNSTPPPTTSSNFAFGSTLQATPVSGVLAAGRSRVVGVNAPSTVGWIQSQLGPGEMITLYNASGTGTVLIQNGSGLHTGTVLDFELQSGDSATFVREDLNLGFRLVATNRSPYNCTGSCAVYEQAARQPVQQGATRRAKQ